jgi:hypothetical protein
MRARVPTGALLGPANAALGNSTGAHLPGMPVATRPGVPATPPAASAAVDGTGTPGGPVLDATALNNIASRQFATSNDINQIHQNEGYARTALQRALDQLTTGQATATQNTQNKYVLEGLGRSGALGQALGQVGSSYADRQATLRDNFSRTQAADASKILGLNTSNADFDQAQGLASAERAAKAAAGDQTLGTPPAPAPAAPPPAATPPVVRTTGTGVNPRTGQHYTFKQVPGGVLHIYPGAQPIFVKGGTH